MPHTQAQLQGPLTKYVQSVCNMGLVLDYDYIFYNLNYKWIEYCLRGICALLFL